MSASRRSVSSADEDKQHDWDLPTATEEDQEHIIVGCDLIELMASDAPRGQHHGLDTTASTDALMAFDLPLSASEPYDLSTMLTEQAENPPERTQIYSTSASNSPMTLLSPAQRLPPNPGQSLFYPSAALDTDRMQPSLPFNGNLWFPMSHSSGTMPPRVSDPPMTASPSNSIDLAKSFGWQQLSQYTLDSASQAVPVRPESVSYSTSTGSFSSSRTSSTLDVLAPSPWSTGATSSCTQEQLRLDPTALDQGQTAFVAANRPSQHNSVVQHTPSSAQSPSGDSLHGPWSVQPTSPLAYKSTNAISRLKLQEGSSLRSPFPQAANESYFPTAFGLPSPTPIGSILVPEGSSMTPTDSQEPYTIGVGSSRTAPDASEASQHDGRSYSSIPRARAGGGKQSTSPAPVVKGRGKDSIVKAQAASEHGKQQKHQDQQNRTKASTGKPETMYASAQAALEEMVGYHQPRVRPTQPYPNMIRLTLLTSKTGKLCLSDLYDAMADHFPWFKAQGPGWKNSIRHNLSINSSFLRIERPKSDDPNVPKGSLWFVDESVEPASVRPPKPSVRGSGSGSSSRTIRSKLVSAAEAGLKSSTGSSPGQSRGEGVKTSKAQVDAVGSDRDAEGETDVSESEIGMAAGGDSPQSSIQAPAPTWDHAESAAPDEAQVKSTNEATSTVVSTLVSTPETAVGVSKSVGGPATLPPVLPQEPTTLSMTLRPSLPTPLPDTFAPAPSHLQSLYKSVRPAAFSGSLPSMSYARSQMLPQGHTDLFMLRNPGPRPFEGNSMALQSPPLSSQPDRRTEEAEIREQTRHENSYFRVNPFAAQLGQAGPAFESSLSATHQGLSDSMIHQGFLAPPASQHRSIPLSWSQPHFNGISQSRTVMPSGSSSQPPMADHPFEPQPHPPYASYPVPEAAISSHGTLEILSGQHPTSSGPGYGTSMTGRRRRRSSSPEWADSIEECADSGRQKKRRQLSITQTDPVPRPAEEQKNEHDQRSAAAQELLAFHAGTQIHAAGHHASTASFAPSAPGSSTIPCRSLQNV